MRFSILRYHIYFAWPREFALYSYMRTFDSPQFDSSGAIIYSAASSVFTDTVVFSDVSTGNALQCKNEL